ncbi:MAG: hypothetical protein JO093_17340 [Acidobacteria bacterium]|nr:hypothetical protein [Acidobacteriota bacterium]MBV9068462.1 hypothetical protein [Acidobacteriota bacterium]MBV9187384.1 hypothetical protein [Acidobacteriota bacterium]
MTLVSRISICMLIAVAAIPAVAQAARRRAVTPAVTIGPTTKVLLTVKDASNGVPVASANVSFAGSTQITTGNGQASLELPLGKPAVVTVAHAAFAPFSQTITAQPGGTYELALTEKPSVTIKTKTNETHIVDIGTAQFANAAIFSNPTRSDTGNFCKEDGTDFTPDKTEFTRITGPGVLETASQCCQFGKVVSANAEMKSGAHLKIYFKDSCSGNEVDFVGREKSTGLYQYYRFTDITEIDFP